MAWVFYAADVLRQVRDAAGLAEAVRVLRADSELDGVLEVDVLLADSE